MTRFNRLYEKSREKSLKDYCCKVVATKLQRCVRAEFAIKTGGEFAVVDGVIKEVYSPFGMCVCITCGVVLPWSGSLGGQGMDAGHFIGRTPSVVLDERGIHPQCKRCNGPNGKRGAPGEYRQYMLHKGGQELIDAVRFQKDKGPARSRVELVEHYITILDRLKAAEKTLAKGP